MERLVFSKGKNKSVAKNIHFTTIAFGMHGSKKPKTQTQPPHPS